MSNRFRPRFTVNGYDSADTYYSLEVDENQSIKLVSARDGAPLSTIFSGTVPELARTLQTHAPASADLDLDDGRDQADDDMFKRSPRVAARAMAEAFARELARVVEDLGHDPLIEALEAEVEAARAEAMLFDTRSDPAPFGGCGVCGADRGPGEGQCGAAICPRRECLHNHHDGCPACIDRWTREEIIAELQAIMGCDPAEHLLAELRLRLGGGHVPDGDV